MVEVYFIITGLIFFAWLYALVRQTQRGLGVDQEVVARPVVPVNLMHSDEAIVIAEDRGRVVYANVQARRWFGVNGGTPSLALMAQMAHPADAVHDLFAEAGHAIFRVGQRRIDASSHVIPDATGRRMVIVMRELTTTSAPTYTDFDPLRALSILSDIGRVAGVGLDVDATVDAILRSLEQSVEFDIAELTLWDAQTETLRTAAQPIVRTPTGGSALRDEPGMLEYQIGEGYSGWIAMYRQPLLINDAASRTDVTSKRFQASVQSFLGVPLMANDQFVGTLELASSHRNAFTQRDVALLQAVGGQAAALVVTARQYEDQAARVSELGGLQQIAQAMSQLGEMSELYGQLTQRIAVLVNVELCGVLLYDEEERVLRSQPPFYGAPDALIEDYALAVVPDTELYTVWNHQPWWFTNDPDSPLVQAMGFEDLRSAVALNQVALLPMIVGARRIGMLLVANKRSRTEFAESDMRMLMSFAAQAAVVAENARLYADEQRRNRELGGLQQIAQAIGLLRNPTELYSQITARIADLMDVQMCGILLYDPARQVLVSQQPFYGMDDAENIDFYQVPSPPGGVVSRLWQERDSWYSNNLRSDPSLRDTDLARMTSVVGMRQTVIASLVIGGSRQGVIQVSNKLDGGDFTAGDARLLSIFAGQAAVLIDNARLYREMQRRTHEAEGLRAVTEIASQVAPLEETMEQVIIAVANLLQSNIVAVGLVEEGTGHLVIRPENVWGAKLDKPYRIDTYATGFERSVLISRRPFISNELPDDEDVLEPYRGFVELVRLRNVLQVPLVVRDRSVGELVVGNKSGGEFYTSNELQLLLSIATQVAAMVDRMRLYEASDQDLRARLQELDALSRVSHELSRTLELDRILDVIRQEALRSTDANAVSVVLLGDRDDWTAPDRPYIEQRYGETRALTDLTPVEREAILTNDVIGVPLYRNSEYEPIPDRAQSALVVPVRFGNQPVGLIHLYSERALAFEQRVTDFVQALTDQAAIAIGNARRYREQLQANQQLRVRAERMGRIFELGELFRRGATLAEMLEEVALGVQDTVGFNIVLISVADDREGVMRRTAQAGLPLPVFEEMQRTAPPIEQALGLMRDEFRIGHSYFLPAEGAEHLVAGLPIMRVLEERMGPGARAWDPQDLLLVPIYGTAGRLLGLMSVDEPRSGRRPDEAIVEALEIFAGQAAFSIENLRLIQRIQHEAEATRRERDRLAQLHMVASEIQSAPDVPSRLQVVADGIHEAGWGKVVITLRDEHLEPTALIQSGYSPDEAMRLSDEVKSGAVWRKWINDLEFHELKLGAGYYMRYTEPWVRANVFDGQPPDPPEVDEDAWHPQDAVYLTLVGQDQKRIIGIISMEDPVDGHVPSEASLQPFELFASQAAAAIETTRLYLETVRAAEQEQRINEVMEVVTGSTSPEAVIQAVGRGLQQMVPFTRMSVSIIDEDAEQFDVLRADIALDSSVTVTRDEPLPLSNTATGFIFAERKAQIYQLSQQVRSNAPFGDISAWFDSGERSTLLVPMIAGGQPVGVMRLGTELEHAFGFEENLDMIQRLANLSAVALDNVRLFQEVRSREQFSAALQRVSASLNQIFDLSNVLRTICDESLPILGVEGAYVWLMVGDSLIGIAASGSAQDTFAGQTVSASNRQFLASRVVSERQPVYINDLHERDDRHEIVPLAELETISAVLGVPLLREDRVLGALMLVEADTEQRFDDVDVAQASAFAVQAAIAIENARLFEEAEQRAQELDDQAQRLALINRISTRLAEALNPEEIYEIALSELQGALGAQYSGLVLFESEAEGRLVLGTHPTDGDRSDATISLVDNLSVQRVRETHRPLASEDVLTDPRFKPVWDTLARRGTVSIMIVPLVMGEHVVGTIGLDYTSPHVFTEADAELALTIASQVSVALEKANLLRETEVRAQELDDQAQRLALINRISTRLAQTLDPQEIYGIVVTELVQAIGADIAGLVLFESESTGRLVVNYPMDEPTPNFVLDLSDNRSIEIVRETRKPLVSEDVMTDPDFEKAWPVLKERGTRSLMIVPLVVGEQVIGTIGLDSMTRRTFSEAQIELAETITSQASLAVEKARLYDETLGLTIFNQAVVESIQQGIVVLGRDLTVRRVNRYMVERYGWSLDAVGQKLFDYRPDYNDFLRGPVAVALSMGEEQAQYEVERRDPSGAVSIRNYYVYPMQEGRQVTGIVLLVEDVSERIRLEADLETRAAQMAALTEVSSQITSVLEPNQVVTLILDALDRVIPYDGVSLWRRVPNREELQIVAARGYEDPDATDADELVGLTAEIEFSPLFREMAEKGQVINVGDISAGDPRFPYGSEAVYKNWLGVPLSSRGNVIGVLTLEKRDKHFYTPLHEQLTLTFANQAAVALENALFFQETRERAQTLNEQAQRLALLNRVSLALAQTLDLENILEISLRETAIALNITEGAAIQIDEDNQLAQVVVEYPRGDAPPDQVYDMTKNAAIQRVKEILLPLVIEDLEHDALGPDLRQMVRRDDVNSALLVPLVVGGVVIGLLRLDAVREGRQFTLEQIELAQTIASQAAIAVQNAALFEQSAIRTRELETLFESAQATAVTLDLNEVVRRVTMQMLSALRADSCTVFLWDDVNNRLVVHGDISTRTEDMPSDQPGDVYSVDDYPLREQSLRQGELKVIRVDDEDLPAAERKLMKRHGAISRMLVPLLVNEIAIGLVEVETLDPNRYFRAEDIRLARTLASQAAISIENARLQTETRRTVEELYIINDMSAALSSAASIDELLEVVELQLPNLTDAEVIYVALYDVATGTISFPLAQSVREEAHLEVPPRPLSGDEFSLILRQQAPLLLAGENIDEVRRSLGIQTLMPHAACFLGVPLYAGDEIIGALGVRDDEDPMAFSHNDQRILSTVGSQLGVAIQSTRLFQQTVQLAAELELRVRERTSELEQERQHIATLYDITAELATSLDMDRLLTRSLEMVAGAVGATQGAILAIDPITERMHFRARLGWPEDAPYQQSMDIRHGLAGWAVQHHESLIVDDAQADKRWMRLGDADDQPRAVMVALIESNEDILGVIMLYSERVGAFHQDQLRLVTAAANQVANAMNNAELYSLIRDQAERLGGMLRQEQVEATKSASILDSVADGVMVADPDGRVIVFNTTAERILGLSAERVLNQPMASIAGLYSSGQTHWADIIEQWIADPTGYEPGSFLEERITLEDERVISVRVSPVHMGDQFLGTVSVFRDITRDVEVDRLKSEFVATVSHELRTPMTSIKGYADLLLLGAAGAITEQQQRFLETIKQNADRLSILVNDLLDISRVDQGKLELKFGVVDVQDLLENVASNLRTRSREDQREMNVDVDLPKDRDLTIWGDYDKIAQVFSNLADNAFNYTPEGGSIFLAAVYNDTRDTVIVSVKDTGIGIPEDVAGRVFERFFRGDETHELVMDTPGTGLGLSIVQEFVQMHRGRVWFESEVGRGTTFYVELPSQAPDHQGAPEATHMERQ